MESFNRDQFFLEEWPNALRSGKYKQGTGTLLRNDLYCCLGVACELLERKGLLSPNDWEEESNLPLKAQELLDIDEEGTLWEGGSRTDLVSINDSGNYNFKDIAYVIVSAYRTESFAPRNYNDED